MPEISEVDAFKALCRENFASFAAKAFQIVEPGIPLEWNWHLDLICDHMQALFEDRLPKRRIDINVPPRTLKSFIDSIAFPAWGMGKDPTKKFICTSFKFPLAKEMAQKCRILMESEWYMDLFPHTRIDEKQNEKHNFWTTQRGFYYSSAIASITGKGGDYVILDDPINPTEALSDTVRVETNNQIANTIPTRFNDLRKSKWIMVMQRLHEDDPTGHFAVKDDRWMIIKLPGENKTGRDIVYELDGKKWTFKAGDLLFPQRLTREVLDELRDDLGEYNYVGQILQEPVPLGGGEFKEDWINYYPQGSVKPKEMNIYILCDPSGGDETKKKKKKLSDWSTFLVIGAGPDNNFYWLDGVRDRLNPTERVDTLFMLHRKWNGLTGKPPKVGYEKYGMMTDTHYIKEKMVQESYHFGLVELGGAMSKEERIRRLIPDLQRGRWWYPSVLTYIDQEGRKFDLVQEIITGEMASFPRSRYDDLLDAMSRIYESELFLVFPKPKATMVKKAYASSGGEDGWEDF